MAAAHGRASFLRYKQDRTKPKQRGQQRHNADIAPHSHHPGEGCDSQREPTESRDRLQACREGKLKAVEGEETLREIEAGLRP